MKKLLFKLFPSFFHVTKQIDFEKGEHAKNPLALCVVDPDTTSTFDTLGLSDERLMYLCKKVKVAMVEEGDRIKALQRLEEDINHVNEFYACVLYMEKEADKLRGREIFEMMMRGKNGNSGGE